MKRKINIGITGGIASGKSTASQWLRHKGYRVLCADEIARALLDKKSIQLKLKKVFGDSILNNDGKIDRFHLAHIVFSNKDKLKILEKIIHPLVEKEIKRSIQKNRDILFVDIPLLFEKNYQNLFDKIVCISATKNQQIRRLRNRNRFSHRHIEDRLKSQMSLAEKRRLSDFIIKNTRDLKHLHRSLEKMLCSLVKPK